MCLFSLKWATEIKKGSSVWISLQNTSRWNAWAGHAFENFCFNHQKVMMKILKLENIVTQTSSWRYLPPRGKKSEKGAQIDLVWMRNDGVLEVFEMKYSENPFSLDKSYAKELQSKVDIFIENISHQGQCFVCLVSPFGLKKGLWNDEVVDKVVMLDDFF